MATIWKSGNQKPTNDKSITQGTNRTISGTTLTSWSRQQKLAMFASFAILGVLLAVSACSKQSPKSALVGVPNRTPAPESPAVATVTADTPSPAAVPTPAKKTRRQRPANVTYTDANFGISFLYPRKFTLISGNEALPQFAGLGAASMNFVQPGGVAVATVEVPGDSYPGTDFTSAFFNVNINRSVSEQECAHFALVDSHNVNGAPAEAAKVKIGSTGMETTSNFAASAMTQTETQYFHTYENGACYEYVMSLGTAGYGIKDGAQPVNRDEVFARLEKIMTTVKISPLKREPLAEPAVASIADAKE
jgi:hypothetical protein